MELMAGKRKFEGGKEHRSYIKMVGVMLEGC